MDDRIYLALYDEDQTKKLADETDFDPASFVKKLVLPGYEFCQVEGRTGIRKARFTEISARLYEPAHSILDQIDAFMAPDLVRHQAMAADDDRLYNVYVYVVNE